MIKNILLLSSLTILVSCSTSKKTNPYEFALMSADVYDAGIVEQLPKHIEPFMDFDKNNFSSPLNINFNKVLDMVDKEDWKQLAPYLAFKAFGKGGYFGRAYINTKSNQIIIAHRGTDIDLNRLKGREINLSKGLNFKELIRDMDDNYDVFKGEIPYQQLAAAKYFTEIVKQDYKQKYGKENPEIIHTGHSLGAILAELSAVENKGKAVTFESPGSSPMVEKYLKTVQVDKNSFKIITYNNVPNSVNLTNPPAGKVYYLKDFDDSKTKNDPFSEEAIQAAIENHGIEEVLQQFDPKTGKPRKRK
jgi:hypothetical protein